jgi:hypothetical protein
MRLRGHRYQREACERIDDLPQQRRIGYGQERDRNAETNVERTNKGPELSRSISKGNTHN